MSGIIKPSDVISVDDNGGSLTVDNTSLSVVGGGTEATALRVTVASDSTGVLSVDDNGASLTIDNATLSVTGGGVESGALRVTLANDSTGLVSVDDNGGSLTVDGTVTANAGSGTFTVDQANAAEIDYDTGGGTVNQVVFGLALPASGGPVAGGTATNPVRTDPTGTTTQPVSDAGSSLTIDNATLSVTGGGTESGALRVTVASDSTGVLSIDDNGGSLTVDGTVAATQSGTWTVQPGNTQNTTPWLVTVHDGSNTATVRNLAANDALNVAIVDGSGDQITSFGGGTQYTEDAAAAANPVGNQLIARRRDSLSAETDTDGDNVAVNTTNKGELYVKHVDAIPVTDNASSLTIDNATLSVTGGGVESGALRVTIANDSTGVLSIDDNGGSLTVDGTVTVSQATASNLNAEVQGDAAHDSPVSGNPVLIGGYAASSAPTSVTIGDAVQAWCLLNGSQVVSLANSSGTLIASGGGLESLALRVTIASDSTGVLSVDDNGGSLTVDGTVTANAGSGTFTVGGVAAHDATVSGNPVLVAGRSNDSAPTAVTADGEVVYAWHDRRGAYKMAMVDDAGDSAMDGTNNALRVNVVAGGAGDGAILDGVSGSIKATVFDYTNANPLSVRLTDTNGDYVSVGGGTQYTEDIAAASDPIGTQLIARRRDSLSTETTTDGDNTAVNSTGKGELYVKHVDAIPVTDNAGSLTIDNATLSVTGGGTESGALRVTIASDSTGVLSIDDNGGSITIDGTVTVSNTVPTTGTVSHDGVASSVSPLLIGGFASAAAPSDVSNTNDAVRAWFLLNGSQVCNLAVGGTLVTGGGGTEATALRVTIASDSTGVLSVDDNGGSLTIDGTVTANAGTGTFTVGGVAANGAAVSGNPVLIAGYDGATTRTVSTDAGGRQIVVGSAAQDTILGTNPVITGGRASDATPTAMSNDGDIVYTWLDRRGATKIAVVDDAGDSCMDSTNNALNVNIVAGGAGDGAILDGVSGSIKATVLDYTNSNPLAVRLTDTNGDYVSAGAGTQYTEDAASASDPVGSMLMARRRDSLSTETTTDGDNTALNSTGKGELYVKHVDAIPVTDNAGSLTIDNAALSVTGGGVEASALRVTLASDSTGVLSVDDNGGSLTVDGTVSVTGVSTLAEQQTQTTALQLLDDVVVTDNGGFTDGTTKLSMSGYIFDEVAGTALTENDAAAARINSNRAQIQVIEDGATRGRWATVSAANALKVDGSAVTQPISAASLPLPSGASTLAEQQTQTTALQLIDDVVHTLNAGVGKAVAIAGVRDDTSTTAATEDAVAHVRITAQRALHTNLRDASGTEMGVAASPLVVGGDVVHGTGDSGSPIKIGFKAHTALPTAEVNNDRVNAIADGWGRQLVSHIDPAMQVWKVANYTSTQTGTSIWDPTAGKKICVTHLSVGAYASTTARLILFFADNADTVYTAGTDQPLFISSFAPGTSSKPGAIVALPHPVFCTTADRELKATTEAGLSVDIIVYGYEWA